MDEINVGLAIIGGSGLYNIRGLMDIQEYAPSTPFGKPSSPIVVGKLGPLRVAFLARHGLGHTLLPTEVPYRANIYALRSLGVERIISISACGSLREDYAPGHIVIPDQLFDHTKFRSNTFFGDGLVAHISTADPFCEDLSRKLEEAVVLTGAKMHRGGAIISIEGPRFSTKAESQTFRTWGMSLIGMTAAPEAFLAREAGMCYAVMAHVTDYDVWHITQAPVTVEIVTQTLAKNTQIAQDTISNLTASVQSPRTCPCRDSLAEALITRPEAIPHDTKTKLRPILRDYLPD